MITGETSTVHLLASLDPGKKLGTGYQLLSQLKKACFHFLVTNHFQVTFERLHLEKTRSPISVKQVQDLIKRRLV